MHNELRPPDAIVRATDHALVLGLPPTYGEVIRQDGVIRVKDLLRSPALRHGARGLLETILWWQDRCWRGIEAKAAAATPR